MQFAETRLLERQLSPEPRSPSRRRSHPAVAPPERRPESYSPECPGDNQGPGGHLHRPPGPFSWARRLRRRRGASSVGLNPDQPFG
jgi:hypothetical protein